jgi:hypothetical protein
MAHHVAGTQDSACAGHSFFPTYQTEPLDFSSTNRSALVSRRPPPSFLPLLFCAPQPRRWCTRRASCSRTWTTPTRSRYRERTILMYLEKEIYVYRYGNGGRLEVQRLPGMHSPVHSTHTLRLRARFEISIHLSSMSSSSRRRASAGGSAKSRPPTGPAWATAAMGSPRPAPCTWAAAGSTPPPMPRKQFGRREGARRALV